MPRKDRWRVRRAPANQPRGDDTTVPDPETSEALAVLDQFEARKRGEANEPRHASEEEG